MATARPTPCSCPSSRSPRSWRGCRLHSRGCPCPFLPHPVRLFGQSLVGLLHLDWQCQEARQVGYAVTAQRADLPVLLLGQHGGVTGTAADLLPGTSVVWLSHSLPLLMVCCPCRLWWSAAAANGAASSGASASTLQPASEPAPVSLAHHGPTSGSNSRHMPSLVLPPAWRLGRQEWRQGVSARGLST